MAEKPRARILNVDDDDAGRYAVTKILTRAGYDVIEAATGRDAVRLAGERPDLILLDVNLPDMSGFEVCNRIKADPRTASIPVVHLSATHVGSADRVVGLEGGADGYLVQPIDPQELVATVRAFLRLKDAEEALAERTRQLEAVRAVSQEIARELELAVLLSLITRRAVELIGLGSGAVFLWDEAAQRLVPRAWHGLGDWMEEVQLSLGEGVIGTVARRREGMIVNDYRRSELAVPFFLERTRISAALAEPLLYRDRLVGVIGILQEGAGRPFTQQNQEVLALFAPQAAIAIENARLHEAVQRQAVELERRVRERTAELEEALRVKADFLANMSHELRTPLNPVIGFAEILLTQTVGPLNEKQARYLEHIHQGGKHLLEIINDILDLIKVEARKLTLTPEELSVAVTLEDSLVLARSLSDKKCQTVEADIEPDLPPLTADPVRFKQILFNLLSNAVKFTPDGGRITLRAYQKAEGRKQKAEGSGQLAASGDQRPEGGRQKAEGSGQLAASGDQRPEGGRQKAEGSGQTSGELPPLPTAECPLPTAECLLPSLVIEVTDTGVGIKPEDLPRLFSEFTQLEASETKHHEGTGLGLALTKRLVELHGGRIWAESEGKRRGSTFTVVLPFTRPGT